MQTYYCYNTSNRIIGLVTAANGDEAWAMARLVQPEVSYLVPAWMETGPFRMAA